MKKLFYLISILTLFMCSSSTTTCDIKNDYFQVKIPDKEIGLFVIDNENAHTWFMFYSRKDSSRYAKSDKKLIYRLNIIKQSPKDFRSFLDTNNVKSTINKDLTSLKEGIDNKTFMPEGKDYPYSNARIVTTAKDTILNKYKAYYGSDTYQYKSVANQKVYQMREEMIFLVENSRYWKIILYGPESDSYLKNREAFFTIINSIVFNKIQPEFSNVTDGE